MINITNYVMLFLYLQSILHISLPFNCFDIGIDCKHLQYRVELLKCAVFWPCSVLLMAMVIFALNYSPFPRFVQNVIKKIIVGH